MGGIWTVVALSAALGGGEHVKPVTAAGTFKVLHLKGD
jgi:hypothetical protein